MPRLHHDPVCTVTIQVTNRRKNPPFSFAPTGTNNSTGKPVPTDCLIWVHAEKSGVCCTLKAVPAGARTSKGKRSRMAPVLSGCGRP